MLDLIKIMLCLIEGYNKNRKGLSLVGYAGYLVILAVFLGISWIIRFMVSQSVRRRVDRKITVDKATFCSWSRELSEES